jgi:hypothetical protein
MRRNFNVISRLINPIFNVILRLNVCEVDPNPNPAHAHFGLRFHVQCSYMMCTFNVHRISWAVELKLLLFASMGMLFAVQIKKRWARSRVRSYTRNYVSVGGRVTCTLESSMESMEYNAIAKIRSGFNKQRCKLGLPRGL